MWRSALAVVAALLVALGPRGFAASEADVAAQAVDAVGMTVANLERSKAFFQEVLSFTVEREYEAAGREIELLTGVFGARTRTARLTLGQEAIELTEFLIDLQHKT